MADTTFRSARARALKRALADFVATKSTYRRAVAGQVHVVEVAAQKYGGGLTVDRGLHFDAEARWGGGEPLLDALPPEIARRDAETFARLYDAATVEEQQRLGGEMQMRRAAAERPIALTDVALERR